MPRNITVTFADGSTHVYQNAPDDVAPEQVSERAQKEFGKQVSGLDGGRKPAQQEPAARQPAPSQPASPNLIATGGAGAALSDPRMTQAMGGGRLPTITTQGMLQGAAGVGDALINTPNRIWNLLGIAPGMAANELGLPAFQPTHDQPYLQRLLSSRGQELMPETTGERYAETVGNVIGGTAAGGGINPSTLLRSLASAGGAGVGLQTAQEMAPNNPLAGLAGAVAGSYLGSKAGAVPAGLARLAGASRGPLPASAESDLVRLGQQRGVSVKTSDVFPPKTKAGKLLQDTGESVPIVGSGGRVAQQGQRQKAVQDLLDEYGVAPGQDFSKLVADDLLKKDAALVAKAQGVKEGVKNALPDVSVSTKSALARIDAEIAQRAKDLGSSAAAEGNALLNEFKQVVTGRDLRSIEEGRKWIGSQLGSPDKAGLKDSLDKSLDRVYGALNDDISTHIRSSLGDEAASKWLGANKALASRIAEAKNTSLGNALNKAEFTPEVVKQMISSLNPSDVARLNANLTSQGRAAARSAVIQKAFDGAFKEGRYSEDAFSTALRKELQKSGAFFKSSDRAELEGLRRLLSETQRASKVGLMTETGAKLAIPVTISGLTGLLSSATGGVAAFGTIGALSRAYESEAVRNFLIRLSKMPPQEVERQAQKVIPAIVAIQEQGAQ